MAQEYVLSLGNRRATLETVGGKGASLTRLIRASMPVPGGFHVTTAAYERFVVESDLMSDIQAALVKVDASKPHTLTKASAKIRDLFLRADMPEEVSRAVSRAYADLDGVDPAVAVRSSSTMEDRADLCLFYWHLCPHSLIAGGIYPSLKRFTRRI